MSIPVGILATGGGRGSGINTEAKKFPKPIFQYRSIVASPEVHWFSVGEHQLLITNESVVAYCGPMGQFKSSRLYQNYITKSEAILHLQSYETVDQEELERLQMEVILDVARTFVLGKIKG